MPTVDQPKIINSWDLNNMPEKDQNALLTKVNEINKNTEHTVILLEEVKPYALYSPIV